MTFPSNFYTDTVTVATYLGRTANGPKYADGVQIPCHVSDVRRLVRDSDGNEATSESSVFADPSWAGALTVGTQVTLSDRVARVLMLAKPTHPLAPQLNHVVAHLT